MKPIRYLLFILTAAALIATACTSTPATAPAATSAPTTAAVPTVAAAPTATPTPAPSPTPAPTNTPASTATPELSGGACLVGTWEFSDMSEYMASIMSQTGGTVEFLGQEGKVLYTFGADGKSIVDAQDFTMKLGTTVQGLTFNIDVTIDGSATGDYAATDDGQVTFSNPQTDGLTLSAKMNDQELFSGTSNELAAMFGVSPDPKYNTFGYECDATTLRYTPPVENAAPVVLKRVSP